MKPFLPQLFTAPADGAPVHVCHCLKERRIQLNRMISFGNRELWHSGIELQLQALQQNQVVNVSLSPPPAQYAVSQNQFHALSLALDSPIEGVQRLKYLHRRASRPLALRPLVAGDLPTLQRYGSCLVVFKPRNEQASLRIRFRLA